MSNRSRDESGRYTEEVSEQAILTRFDTADAPFLTAPEIADEFGVTRQAVTYRLKEMRDRGLVDRKQAGASSVGWWATAAPAPSDETRRDIEATERELEHNETMNQTEVKRKIASDGDGETA